MPTMTITEALADLKTMNSRITKKQEFILQFIGRSEGMKDPLGKDGGSFAVLSRERQSIADLQRRHVAIRTAIQQKNHAISITIRDQTKTVAEWLTWRKEIAPVVQAFLAGVRGTIGKIRQAQQTKGYGVVSAIAVTAETKPQDVVINVDELALGKEVEALEEILGTLDGQLSLKNATTTVEIPD